MIFSSRLARAFTLAILIASCTLPVSPAATWPQFRGPNCAGVSELDLPPLHFGPETNFLWKTSLPTGASSPVIWENHIFLTAVESNQLHTICVRRHDGNILWRQTAPAEKLEQSNSSGSPAASTPAADGRRVYVYFGSCGVLAYDFEGRELWRKSLPFPAVFDGTGSSPALIDGRLLINRDQEHGKSSLLALDSATGKTLWETPRPGFFSSYATPILWRHGPTSDVVLSGSYRVVGYDLNTGHERWSARGTEALSVCATPVVDADYLYFMSYSFGGGKVQTYRELLTQMDDDKNGTIARTESKMVLTLFDLLDVNKDAILSEPEWNANVTTLTKGEHGLFALRSPGPGDVTATHISWKQKKGAATVPSPLLYRGRLYTVQDGGRVSCYDAKSGAILFEQERLNADGHYLASPVAANGLVYFCSARGTISVLEAADTFKLAAQTRLAEPIIATPAIADHKLYIRTGSHLWAFGNHSTP